MKIFFVIILVAILSLSWTVTANAQSPDVKAPIPLNIYNSAVNNITTSSATITWETNQNASSQVLYGLEADASTFQTIINGTTSEVTRHSVDLTGLQPSTVYYFRVKSSMGTATAYYDSPLPFETLPAGTGTIGSGPGGGMDTPVKLSGLNQTGNLTLAPSGNALGDVMLKSLDGQMSLFISKGTLMLDASKSILPSITAAKITTLPAPPPGYQVMMGYELSPAGATLDPSLTLSIKYDTYLPSIIAENTLRLAYWSGSNWISLGGNLDPSARTVTAKVSRFSVYALIADSLQPTVAPTSLPSLTPAQTQAPVPVLSPSVSPPATVPEQVKTSTPTETAVVPIPVIPQTPTEEAAPASSPELPFSALLMTYLGVFTAVAAGSVAFFLRRQRLAGKARI